MVHILSPVAGVRRDVSTMPDPVFATGLVGPGAAIMPSPGKQVAVAPVSGLIAKAHPHAFIVQSDTGPSVLVHLGIDTVHLGGEGFAVLVEEHAHVEAGDEVVRWDPAYVEQSGYSPICAVVVLDCPFPTHALGEPGSAVDTAEALFDVDC